MGSYRIDGRSLRTWFLLNSVRGAGLRRDRRSMKPIIQRVDAAAEYYTDERCDILELSNSVDDPAVSIARARVAPGVTTRWHRLAGTTERYVIVEGRGRAEVGDLAQEVEAG